MQCIEYTALNMMHRIGCINYNVKYIEDIIQCKAYNALNTSFEPLSTQVTRTNLFDKNVESVAVFFYTRYIKCPK